MHRPRFPGRLLMGVVTLAALGVAPLPAAGAAGGSPQIVAYLDGRPIRATEVGNWYCEDFEYPVINCSADPAKLQSRVTALLSTTAVSYVVIYDYTTYAGSYMYVSEDYTVLAWIGWNDRISSLRGVNSQTSHLFTDWFYLGNSLYVYGNAQYASLGGFDNSFSSIHRN